MKKYIPFVLLSVEQGKAIQAYNRNEDKYRKRQNNNGDAFGYDDGITENMHSEVSVPDFIEQSLIDSYYEERPVQLFDDERTEEADKVSSRIAEILSETAFSFSPNEYVSIHRKLFQGIYKRAGKIRDYNITNRIEISLRSL